MVGHALKCTECGVEFMPFGRQKYCSTRCQARSNKREWVRQNPEKHAAHQREWVRKNPEKHATYSKTAYAKRKGEYVYVLTPPVYQGFVKVGRCADPTTRLSGYNTGDHLRRYTFSTLVAVPDAIAAEAGLHKLLSGYRVGSTEWFQLEIDDAATLVNQYLAGGSQCELS